MDKIFEKTPEVPIHNILSIYQNKRDFKGMNAVEVLDKIKEIHNKRYSLLKVHLLCHDSKLVEEVSKPGEKMVYYRMIA